MYSASLLKRIGFFKNCVPNKMAKTDSGSPILFVAASVSVQKKYLYVDVKGYSQLGVSWTLDYFSIYGNIEQFNGPWNRLKKYLSETRFVSDNGKNKYRIQITLVDSAHYTKYVYEFVKRHPFGVYACKSANNLSPEKIFKLFPEPVLKHIGLNHAFFINTEEIKNRINEALTNSFWYADSKYQPRWFPNFPENLKDYYLRLAIDTYVYNLAALEIAATYYCIHELKLKTLDWSTFWTHAQCGAFYEGSVV